MSEASVSSHGFYTLPCGWPYRKDGVMTRLRHVHMREMTGEDEDLIAATTRLSGEKQVAKFTTLVAKLVEGFSDAPAGMVGGLTVAECRQFPKEDFDYLLICMRRAALGDELTYEVECPKKECHRKQSVSVDLSTLEITPLLPDDDPRWTLLVSSRSGKTKSIKLRLPLLSDMSWQALASSVLPDADASIALALSIESIDDVPCTFPLKHDDIRMKLRELQKLTYNERDQIRTGAARLGGEFDGSVDHECPACNTRWSLPLVGGVEGFFSNRGSDQKMP